MIKKVNLCILIAMILLAIFPTVMYSTDVTANPGGYAPGAMSSGDATKVEGITSKVLTMLTNIGIVVSVISVAVIGIKYMLGSVEEKASYKENIIPYITGIVLIFGISMIVKAIQAVGNKINV